MPDINTIAPNGVVNLSDSPSSLDDATFDALFPAEPQTVVSAPQTANPIPPAPSSSPQPSVQAQPVAQPSNQPFIKANTSVYNTQEAAVQGINQKDALIEQLRQRYALTTGIDPITGQAVGASLQPQQSEDYNVNPSKYMTDLYQAAKTSPEAYRDVQAKFFYDTNLKPLQPIMQRIAVDQAKQTLQSEVPDAPAFIGTQAYQKTLDSNSELKEAIAVAETDYKFHSRLPALYKLAYYAGQGQQLPELLRANASQSQPQPTTAIRPTVQPTTPALQTSTVRPNLKTLDGIRAVIADQEAKGVSLEF